jgi:hypothetical protein
MHRSLCVLFALLSLTDLALTRWLIDRSGSPVYEANPIAKWCLDSHGWPGMACFKGGLVLLVMGLYAIIFRYRPRAASRVLGFGCTSLILVVGYSAALCQTPLKAADEEEGRQHLAKMNNETRKWNRQRDTMLALLAELRQRLLVERCTLREAVDRLATLEQGKLSEVLRAQIRPYRNIPVAQSIAAFVISHAVSSVKDKRHCAAQLGRRLAREFEQTYSSAVPAMVAGLLEGVEREAVQ